MWIVRPLNAAIERRRSRTSFSVSVWIVTCTSCWSAMGRQQSMAAGVVPTVANSFCQSASVTAWCPCSFWRINSDCAASEASRTNSTRVSAAGFCAETQVPAASAMARTRKADKDMHRLLNADTSPMA